MGWEWDETLELYTTSTFDLGSEIIGTNIHQLVHHIETPAVISSRHFVVMLNNS